jgi:hypothetical protein
MHTSRSGCLGLINAFLISLFFLDEPIIIAAQVNIILVHII